jgi:hypothetical protein
MTKTEKNNAPPEEHETEAASVKPLNQLLENINTLLQHDLLEKAEEQNDCWNLKEKIDNFKRQFIIISRDKQTTHMVRDPEYAMAKLGRNITESVLTYMQDYRYIYLESFPEQVITVFDEDQREHKILQLEKKLPELHGQFNDYINPFIKGESIDPSLENIESIIREDLMSIRL